MASPPKESTATHARSIGAKLSTEAAFQVYEKPAANQPALHTRPPGQTRHTSSGHSAPREAYPRSGPALPPTAARRTASRRRQRPAWRAALVLFHLGLAGCHSPVAVVEIRIVEIPAVATTAIAGIAIGHVPHAVHAVDAAPQKAIVGARSPQLLQGIPGSRAAG